MGGWRCKGVAGVDKAVAGATISYWLEWLDFKIDQGLDGLDFNPEGDFLTKNLTILSQPLNGWDRLVRISKATKT